MGGANDLGSAKKVGAASAEIRANTSGSWPPTVLPRDAQSDYTNVVKIFAYGAQTPAEDADVHDEESLDSDDYAAHTVRLLKSIGSKGKKPPQHTASETQTHAKSFQKNKIAVKAGIG